MRKFIFDDRECTHYSDKEMLVLVDMILTRNLEVTYKGKMFAIDGIENIVRSSTSKIRELERLIVRMEKLQAELEKIPDSYGT